MSKSSKFFFDDTDERTLVLYDPIDMVNAAVHNFSQIRINMDICCDDQGAAVTIDAVPIWKGFNDLKIKGLN